MKIWYKEKRPNGRRHIYLFGVRVFSYGRRGRPFMMPPFSLTAGTEYARSLGVTVGNNVTFAVHPYPFSFPDFGSEPYLIEIGDDCLVSFGVTFLTHDVSHLVFMPLINAPMSDQFKYKKFGRIKVGRRTFIGCRCIIMPGVTIGDNCIIGAGSVVTKSIPDGQVWAGNPAQFIMTTEKLAQSRAARVDSDDWREIHEFVRKKQS